MAGVKGVPRLKRAGYRKVELDIEEALETKGATIIHWPKRAERFKRKQEARRALPEEVIRLDVDWREVKGADFESITIPADLWSNLVLMAMKAGYR